MIPFICAALGGWWWFTKGSTSGSIRLGDHRAFGNDGSGIVDTLASIPYFLVGVMQEAWSWVERKVPLVDGLFTRRTPYRQVPIDDDGEFESCMVVMRLYQPKCWDPMRMISGFNTRW